MNIFFLFIVNPVSGGLEKDSYIEEIKEHCHIHNIRYDFIETTQENNEEKIRKAISEKQPSAVIVCGGDGTVNFVGTLLLEQGIPLGIVPLGSANGLATEFGIELDIEQIIASYAKGNTIEMDVLLINGKFHCFHLGSIGVNAEIIERKEKNERRGMWGYVIGFFETLFSRKHHRISITANESSKAHKAIMVTFANATKYGTGAVINPMGKVDDGVFEVCVFKPYPWYALFQIAYLFFLGGIKESPYTKYLQTKKAKAIAKREILLEVDGDVKGKFTEFEVEILSSRITMFT